MVLSMALLCSFVGYWLDTQYKEEKRIFRGLVYDLYHNTHAELQFRSYYKIYIKPALELKEREVYSNSRMDSLGVPPEIREGFFRKMMNVIQQNQQKYDDIFYFLERGIMIPDSIKDFTERYYDLRNVRFDIINGYRIGRYDFLSYRQNNESNEFRSLFEEKCASRYGRMKLRWNENKDMPLNEDILCIDDYSEETQNRFPLVIFENYRFYVLKAILQQIIFVLVLIGLSAFALLFTYRSYIAQNRLNRIRTDFVNNITHELKIPVSTAKAALEAIGNYGIIDDPDKLTNYLDMMKAEMSRLDMLTSRVLEHSKLESNHQLLVKQTTNLNTLLNEVVRAMKILYKSSGTIFYNQPIDMIYVNGDPVYLEGVIRNLIENSVKYGGDDVGIVVDLRVENKVAIVLVRDNGPGIPKEYLSKVFDKFFRVPTGDKHTVKGFGLGLSFAYLVMKQHGGNITVENLPNDGGCEIKLTIPTLAV